jgi:hypothetical protein
MPSGSFRHLTLLAGFLIAPALGLSSTITVNGIFCEAGTCPTVDTLAFGSSTSGSFNFDLLFANTDRYNITGQFSANNPTTGATAIQFNATAVFAGNSTSTSSQHDLLTIDDLQNYTVPHSLNGNYFEDTSAFIGGPIAPASSFSAELSYNGNGLGVLGPFTVPGSNFASASRDLLGLTSPLEADFQFNFDFATGSRVGSFISTVPEPGGVVPLTVILAIGLGFPAVRRYRLGRRAA